MYKNYALVLGSLWISIVNGMEPPPLDADHQKLIDICITGNAETLQNLLESKSDLSKKITELDHSSKCALDYAQEHDHDALLKVLYKKLTQEQKNELLRRAADAGNVYIANQYIEHGAQIVHKANLSPFQLAAQNGHTKIINLLLEKSPTIKEQFNYGLAIASQRGHKDLISWFIAKGAQLGHIDPESGKTPKQLAKTGMPLEDSNSKQFTEATEATKD